MYGLLGSGGRGTSPKMNGNYGTVETRSTPSRYRRVSTRSRLRFSITFTKSPSYAATRFSYAIVLFACSYLLCWNATSAAAERSSDYADSPNNYGNDAAGLKEPAVRKCTTCNKLEREALENLTLEEIKAQILLRLGFANGTPNASHMLSKLPPVDLVKVDGFHHRTNHIRHEKFGTAFMVNDEARFDDADDGLKPHTVTAKAKEGESGT